MHVASRVPAAEPAVGSRAAAPSPRPSATDVAAPGPPAAPRRLERLFEVVALGWLVFAAQYAALGRWRTVVLDLVVFACMVAIVAVAGRVTHPPLRRALGQAGLAVSALGLAGAAMLSGQSSAMAPWFLVLAPLLAAYLDGAGAAMLWCAIGSALVVLVHASAVWMPVEPEFVAAGPEVAGGQIILSVVVLAFGIVARRTTDRQLADACAREEVIQTQNRELERRAADLLEARDRALEAASAKDRFLATMSHELRTPLNSVIGFASVLAKRDDPPLTERDREYVERIRSNGEHLLGLIDRVLDLSEVEAGRETLSVSVVSLPQLVRSVAHQLEPQATRKGLVLDVEAPERTGPVETDSTKLRQVLINLIGNAIQFTTTGGVTVRVLVEGPDGTPAAIEIADTGPGIPPDRIERIFEPFEQIDGSSAREHQGTGLGLSISRSLCVLMGHRLTARSTQGEGAVFRIELGNGAGRPAPAPPGRTR